MKESKPINVLWLSLCAKGFHRRNSSYGRGKAIEEIVKENLLNRQFEQSQIDAVWVTDITYIPCNDGRLYLYTYIDLATRIPRCYGELPTVIHSDRDSQYRSLIYQELLTDHHITHSMSQPETPVDNAVIESFHRSNEN